MCSQRKAVGDQRKAVGGQRKAVGGQRQQNDSLGDGSSTSAASEVGQRHDGVAVADALHRVECADLPTGDQRDDVHGLKLHGPVVLAGRRCHGRCRRGELGEPVNLPRFSIVCVTRTSRQPRVACVPQGGVG